MKKIIARAYLCLIVAAVFGVLVHAAGWHVALFIAGTMIVAPLLAGSIVWAILNM